MGSLGGTVTVLPPVYSEFFPLSGKDNLLYCVTALLGKAKKFPYINFNDS